MTTFVALLSDQIWHVIIIATIFLIAIIATWMVQNYLHSSKIFAHDKKLQLATKTPLIITIWAIAIYLLLLQLELKSQLRYLDISLLISVIIAAVWQALNFIDSLERKWHRDIKNGQSKLDLTTCGAIIKLLRITTIAVAVLVALEAIGISISALIALGSASGFGISFAAKDMISNYFGALMIYMDKPFKVGELIKIPGQDIMGYVDQIGARSTVIITSDKRPIYVPNAIFSNISIENLSRMTHRLIDQHITIRHQDKLAVESIVKDIIHFLHSHQDIDKAESLIVAVDEITEVGIRIMIYCCTTATSLPDYHSMINRLLLKSLEIVGQYKAVVATHSFFAK